MASQQTKRRGMREGVSRGDGADWLRKMGSSPLLTKEEELELGKILKESKDPKEVRKARDKFALANVRLVAKIASRYSNRGDFNDLIAAGIEGLLGATGKFDYEKGYKFSTFAYWWIRQAITRRYHNEGTVIRLPSNTHEAAQKIKKAVAMIRIRGGDVSNDSIAAEARMLPEKVVKIRGMVSLFPGAILSLNKRVGADEECDLEGLIGGSESSLMDSLESTELVDTVRSILATLTETEQIIFRARYGIDGAEPESFYSIGERTGLCHERVRNIHKKAIRRLRSQLDRSYLALLGDS